MFHIPKKDLRIERFRATGNGGQNVNVRDTAIRITHIPTGIQSQCQDERSQGKNLSRAMETLRERIQAERDAGKLAKIAELRDEQIGSGATRVRTYDFSANTVIDHRTGVKTKRLKDVLNGDLDLVW